MTPSGVDFYVTMDTAVSSSTCGEVKGVTPQTPIKKGTDPDPEGSMHGRAFDSDCAFAAMFLVMGMQTIQQTLAIRLQRAERSIQPFHAAVADNCVGVQSAVAITCTGDQVSDECLDAHCKVDSLCKSLLEYS